MNGVTPKRVAGTVVVSGLVATLSTLIAFVIALFYGLITGRDTRLPGLIDFTRSAQAMSVQPSGRFGLTIAVLALALIPATWSLLGRSSRR